MKPSFIHVLIVLFAFSIPTFSQTGRIQPKLADASTAVVRGASTGRLGSIDPAVTDISFRYLKPTTGDKIQVVVTVKNLGLMNYESGSNQQNVQLWEEYSGSNRKMVKLFPFQNLNASASFSFSYERPVFKPSDEFPPHYKAMIVYEPDILSDNNTKNDDSNAANNSLTKNPRD